MAVQSSFRGKTRADNVVNGVVNSGEGTVNVNFNDKSGRRHDILKWLSDFNPQTHHDVVHRRQNLDKLSGAWLWGSEGKECVTFHEWRDVFSDPVTASQSRPGTQPHQFSWLYGNPGIGKTVIASIIIDHLQMKENGVAGQKPTGVCWSYIESTKVNAKQPLSILVLRSLSRALVQKIGEIPESIQELYDRHAKYETLPPSEAWLECLRRVCETQHHRVYVVIDALDEAGEKDRKESSRWLEQLPNNTKISLTSRYLEVIENAVHSVPKIAVRAHEDDVRLFIKREFEENSDLMDCSKESRNDDLKAAIETALLQKAEYSFLVVRLCMEDLMKKRTAHDSRRALRDLPAPKEIYSTLIKRIKQQSAEDREWAKKILTWTCYAEFPSTDVEMRYMIGSDTETPDLNHDRRLPRQYLTTLCAGSTVIRRGTNEVSMIHSEPREYFLERQMSYFPDAHFDIASTYIAHLTAIARAADSQSDYKVSKQLERITGRYLRHIVFHIQQTAHQDVERRMSSESITYNGTQETKNSASRDMRPLSTQLRERLIAFSDNDRTRASICSIAIDGLMYPGKVRTEVLQDFPFVPSKYWYTLRPNPLHIAAALGWLDVATHFASNEQFINAKDGKGETPLSLASRNGNRDVAAMLVDHGAEFDLRNEATRNIFLIAVNKGYIDIVQDLSKKAEEHTKGNRRLPWKRTPSTELSSILAAYHGDNEVARKKIGALQDRNSHVAQLAFFIAADQGHWRVLSILMNAGMDPNCKDPEGRTALHRAAKRNDTGMASVLLKNGARSDEQDESGATPWTEAIICGVNQKMEAFLVEKGTNVNVTDKVGVNLLYGAAAGGHLDYMRRMSDAGTNPSIQTKYGWTPLHWAASGDFYEATRSLLERGAFVNPMSDTNYTPLDQTFRSGQYKVFMKQNSLKVSKGTTDVNRTILPCRECGFLVKEDTLVFICESCGPATYILCDACLLHSKWCSDLEHPLYSRWNEENNRYSGIAVNRSWRDEVMEQSVVALLRSYGAKRSKELHGVELLD